MKPKEVKQPRQMSKLPMQVLIGLLSSFSLSEDILGGVKF